MSDMYLIQGETLTNLGNSVRALDGTTENLSPVQMKSNLDTFNGELGTIVTEQDNLIAQIAAALEWKAAGNGDGSGGSAEMCTVTLVNGMTELEWVNDPPYMYVGVFNESWDEAVNELWELVTTTDVTDELVITVAKGSVIYVWGDYEAPDDLQMYVTVPSGLSAIGGGVLVGHATTTTPLAADACKLYYIYGDCTITATAETGNEESGSGSGSSEDDTESDSDASSEEGSAS